jgi:hypothetical protein
LYSDELELFGIGRVCDVRDASRIEFNELLQRWEVIDVSTNQVVHLDTNRERAIDWEIAHFAPGGEYYHG